MRTHDSDIKEAVNRAASAVDLAAVSVPAAAAPNVRVAPGTTGAWCTGDIAGVTAGGPQEGAGNARGRGRGTQTHGAETHGARDATRRPGRPRSERAEQAILDAAIEAVGENGIDGVSCEDVAARAGVGKATLYRRWAGKEDLLIAAFASTRRPPPEPRGESVREDLIALLTVIAADADDPRYAQQFALLHGAAERYPRLVARYKEQVVEPRRELIRVILRRGIDTGELRPGTDVEVAMLLLTGAVMVRGKHDPNPAAPGFVDRAVDELLEGITARLRGANP
jgi:AcrR family transcriptional regulator